MVPGALQRPVIVFPLQVGVELVFQVVAAPRRGAQRNLHAAEPHRVVEDEPIAEHGRHVVPRLGIGKARHNGIGTREAHLLEHVVGSDVVVDIAEVNLGQRFLEQAQRLKGLAVLLVGHMAVQLHGIGIFDHLAGQLDGAHAVALKLQSQQLAGLRFQGRKQADVGIGEHLRLMGGDVNLPEV